MLTAMSLDPAAIAADQPNPVLAFAADELATHLRMAGAAGAGTVELSAAAGATDGFTAVVATGSVRIRGESARGTLNGVYWLLEQLGFAWVEPGERGARFVPRKSLAEGEYRESPSFPRRTLILGQDALHDDWPDWMEWASRNRYNDIFFHDTPPSVWDRAGKQRPSTAEELDADRRGWMFERWDADGSRIVGEAGKRGLTLQFGGHHLPTLVPRDEFERHPDWFPLRNGARDPKYNLCTATPKLRDYLAQRTEACLARFAGADIYHFWGDDIRGGGWCGCPTCGAMSPSDQALLATNLIAETVARVTPRANIAHLAYHDTLEPPTIEPRENVTALFAPRERCYAHAIDDRSCHRNVADYWEPFTRFAALFPAGRMQVFEYYSDAILFKGLAPTHLSVLPGDSRAYRSAGVWNMGNLMVGDRPWVGPPWHAWWTARCLWDADVDRGLALRSFCEAAYGPAFGSVRGNYQLMDHAYGQLLDLHDLEPLPRHDVLDFSDRPRETLTEKARQLRRAAAAFLSMPALLGELEGELPARDRAQAEFVAVLARHLAARVSAWDQVHGGEPDAAQASLADAEAALAEINAWDERHNTPAYAVISRPMRRAMAYHLNEIRRIVDG